MLSKAFLNVDFIIRKILEMQLHVPVNMTWNRFNKSIGNYFPFIKTPSKISNGIKSYCFRLYGSLVWVKLHLWTECRLAFMLGYPKDMSHVYFSCEIMVIHDTILVYVVLVIHLCFILFSFVDVRKYPLRAHYMCFNVLSILAA